MTKAASIIFIIFMSFLSGALGLWVADREPPVTDIRYDPEQRDVTPGGTLTFKAHVNRNRICQTTAERLLVDSTGAYWRLPTSVYQVPGYLGEETYRTIIDIPGKMEVGPATLRTFVTWECNPWHNFFPIQASLPELHFNVK